MMNILNKLLTKKKIVLLALGTLGFIALALILSLMNQRAVQKIIPLLVVAFFVALALFLFLTFLSVFYYVKRERNIFILINGALFAVLSILFMLSIPGMLYLETFVKIITTGTINEIFKLVNLGTISALENYLRISIYVLIGGFIYNVIIFLIHQQIIRLNNPMFTWLEGNGAYYPNDYYQQPYSGTNYNNPNQQAYSGTNYTNPNQQAYTGTNYTNPNQQANYNVSGNNFNQGAYNNYQQPTRPSFFATKQGKTIIGCILALVLVIGGFFIYDNYFNKTNIDLMSNLKVEFSGYDGEGIMKISQGDIKYDKSNTEIADFLKGVTYSYNGAGTLKNGDKVNIYTTYSSLTASRLKLNITGVSKTVTVKGLTEVYSKASDVPAKIQAAAKKRLLSIAESYYKTNSTTQFSHQFVSLYFGNHQSIKTSDIIAAVFKVDYTVVASGTTGTYYDVLYLYNNINSDLIKSIAANNTKSFHVYIYDANNYPVSNEADIESGLSRLTNYTFTKFK